MEIILIKLIISFLIFLISFITLNASFNKSGIADKYSNEKKSQSNEIEKDFSGN